VFLPLSSMDFLWLPGPCILSSIYHAVQDIIHCLIINFSTSILFFLKNITSLDDFSFKFKSKRDEAIFFSLRKAFLWLDEAIFTMRRNIRLLSELKFKYNSNSMHRFLQSYLLFVFVFFVVLYFSPCTPLFPFL